MLNTSRVRLDAFASACAASVPDGSLVLDAGAGSCLYRHHFLGRGHRYESADFGEAKKASSYGELTYRCRLEAIPVEDGRFDLVLCSQVLEHLPEPGAVLRELHRVLRPGARVWVSAPFCYEEHETPYDFYRYTQFGMRHQLEAAGFTVERLDRLEGYGMTLAYQLAAAADWLPRGRGAYGGGARGGLTSAAVSASRPLFRVLARLLASADLRRPLGVGYPKNYLVVARKPPE